MQQTIEQWSVAVEKVTGILKVRFPNLTAEEVVKLALQVVRAVDDSYK